MCGLNRPTAFRPRRYSAHRSRGNLAAHRATGRAAVTSHRGTSATVLRASDRPACRQARMPATGRRGGRMSPAPLRTSRRHGTGRRGDRHRTGAEAQSLPPPDAKGSGWVERPPIKNLDWWSRPSRLPDHSQWPDVKAGVAMKKRALPRPTNVREVARSEGPRR
jgi:hypothetical protein